MNKTKKNQLTAQQKKDIRTLWKFGVMRSDSKTIMEESFVDNAVMDIWMLMRDDEESVSREDIYDLIMTAKSEEEI